MLAFLPCIANTLLPSMDPPVRGAIASHVWALIKGDGLTNKRDDDQHDSSGRKMEAIDQQRRRLFPCLSLLSLSPPY